ncbi:MAG TPA: TlpA disulfide reductase family protein [Candidatus Dormibacteraeota bacterium]|nr:TlpA disulfide reductase family protein [Candidatus Dormibacteraeota bacterium]
MSKRKNRWLKVALVLSLLSIAVGCDRNASNGSTSGGIADLGPAPAVSFRNLDGQTVNLAQYHGKVVLVNFWATWCEPCKAEIPDLIQIQKKYGNRNFTVLGVAMDQEGKSVVAPFAAKPQFVVAGQTVAMDYPIVLGTDQIATQFGGIIGLPTSYVISKNGQVVKRVIGMIDPQEIDRLIQQLLSS